MNCGNAAVFLRTGTGISGMITIPGRKSRIPADCCGKWEFPPVSRIFMPFFQRIVHKINNSFTNPVKTAEKSSRSANSVPK
jgi:hypothetical protein